MDKSIYSSEYQHFLNLLKEARIEKGITQEALAECLNETQSFISKCERGERRLDVVELLHFLIAMEISPNSFFKKLTDRITT